jgi:uncharacterized protein (DUF433 family)
MLENIIDPNHTFRRLTFRDTPLYIECEHHEASMYKDRIISDPEICGGEPTIKDTRIPAHVILSHLAAGEDHGTVLKNFPRLTEEDILACLEFASYLAVEKEIPVP